MSLEHPSENIWNFFRFFTYKCLDNEEQGRNNFRLGKPNPSSFRKDKIFAGRSRYPVYELPTFKHP